MALRRDIPRTLKTLATSGLAVTVTGLFGVAVVWVQSSEARRQATCAQAREVVNDDALNPALGKAISVRIAQRAADRLERCFKDD